MKNSLFRLTVLALMVLSAVGCESFSFGQKGQNVDLNELAAKMAQNSQNPEIDSARLVSLLESAIDNIVNDKLEAALSEVLDGLEMTHPMPPAAPDYMVFAGDTVWLTRPDIRERMEREIIAFTYMHSTSLLMLKRSTRIFPQVEPILAENGVPDDLKYLMVIESNLDPAAVSSAGAAGLWQFMKGTAKDYGLEVSATVDERYNIDLATAAACRYLISSYQKFGNWMSVGASYNAGPKAVSDRMEKQHQRDPMDLWIFDETARYMFRMLTAKMFFADPSAFGYTISPDSYYPYKAPKRYVTVVDDVPDLVEFAERQGVSYADLKRANRWLRDSKLVAGRNKQYRIAIP
jgi:Soluble lytic murein transglycosylase and related regulatory proteins (some contain LysM/invasin domains)